MKITSATIFRASSLLTAVLVLSIAFLLTLPIRAAEITYDSSDHSIFIDGDIDSGDLGKFNSVYYKAPSPVEKIKIRSNGGIVADAFEMALFAREMNIPIVAIDHCYSACAYMWLANPEKKLYVSSLDVVIAIHVPITTFSDGSQSTTVEDIGAAAWYLGAVGVPYTLAIQAVETPNILGDLGARIPWDVIRNYGYEVIVDDGR